MISVNKSAAQKSGFILVEALIAVGLLVTAFGAISQASSLSLEGFRTAKSNYIAGKIAQEGIELVINKRDNHVQCVNSDDSCPINQWHQNLKGTWLPDATETDQLLPDNTFDTYSSNPNHTICRVTAPDKHLGKFSYCSEVTGEEIPGEYNRKVEVTNPGGGGGINKLQVVSVVTWGEDNRYVLEEVLFGSN